MAAVDVREDRVVTGDIVVGSTAWREWLSERDGFRYECGEGSFSARRERRRDSTYWYAYRKRFGKLRKLYLGRSEDLCTELMLNIARLMSQSPSEWEESKESSKSFPTSQDDRVTDTPAKTKTVVPSVGSIPEVSIESPDTRLDDIQNIINRWDERVSTKSANSVRFQRVKDLLMELKECLDD